jgi:hypothetical protein
MVLDIRVRRLGSSDFRSRLTVGDIVDGVGEVVEVSSSNAELSNDDIQYYEDALVFIDKPIVLPNMPYLYNTRLYRLDDVFLLRVIGDLVFLNPGIGSRGINKMVSWIVRFLVGENDSGDKVLSYEQLHPMVGGMIGLPHVIIENDRIIVYQRESLLEGSDKRWYSNHYRDRYMSILAGELIHQGALLASKRLYEKLILSKGMVLHHTKDINAIKTLNKHIEDRTVSFLEDENNKRYFKTKVSVDKFKKFVEIYDESISLSGYEEMLGISRKTAVEFKRILNSSL